MGKGDIKTRRGKLFRGSYGISRPRKRKVRGVPGPEMAQLKDTAKKEIKPKATTEQIKEVEVKEEIVQEATVVEPTPEVTAKVEEKTEATAESSEPKDTTEEKVEETTVIESGGK